MNLENLKITTRTSGGGVGLSRALLLRGTNEVLWIVIDTEIRNPEIIGTGHRDGYLNFVIGDMENDKDPITTVNLGLREEDWHLTVQAKKYRVNVILLRKKNARGRATSIPIIPKEG